MLLLYISVALQSRGSRLGFQSYEPYGIGMWIFQTTLLENVELQGEEKQVLSPTDIDWFKDGSLW